MMLYDLNNFEKLSKEKQTEVKKEIVKGNELELIPSIYLPTPVSKEYYFISYSHKNYREVYIDLFDLESIGFSFWYDRGIPAGSNWKEIAVKYLEPFDCKGVVFYISEEALISDAIFEEINFTQEKEKPFIVIYLGKDPNLTALIKRLYIEKKIDVNKYNLFLKMFPEDIIYLKYQEPAETKKEKIMNSLPKQKLLSLQMIDGEHTSRITEYDIGEEILENDETTQYITPKSIELNVDGSNNYYVKDVKAEDFVDALSLIYDINNIESFEDEYNTYKFNKIKDKKEIDLKCEIDRFAFSNLLNLESVELPSNVEILDCAFGRNKKLRNISFVDFANKDKKVSIGDFAFYGCESLEHFDFSHVTKIGEGAFKRCFNLKEAKIGKSYASEGIAFAAFEGCIHLESVTLPNNLDYIGESAFHNTGIKSVILPEKLRQIRSYAFSFCGDLKKITFNEGLEEIHSYAFYFSGGRNKWELVLPKSLTYIGTSAFAFSGLKKITYNDTSKNFLKVAKECFRPMKKGDSFLNQVELVCTDSKIMIVPVEDEDAYFWNK